ncbi:GntR family transcriptional regulator [Corallococcus sp. AB049A]|uniref:GntR family transcriptional regulator n=2 Tax=Corallococcus interemptor TaxID=2316720 RepID=A0A3A8QK38_9BACT|nr:MULTISPECIES: GntR family transcriptional regulator [Corallococcus]RKH50365.1 GntR family transcriptional regulator [Corallococcus sp. AB050B]RKH68937.1 GntR family transcriptional regulator [Corallococcus interemptor]RKI65095.1 GntR family transcriptional regulator [Corallococcus sp. AB049A]
MGMGHGGLVAYVEAQIERDIALGRIHPSGQFGSEAKLARHYDVCRGTIREALRRLAARGVVVQRPGRKTRAVPLDESLTLENLGLALRDMCSPDARWLLEGYFSLRRQVLVELLSDCCARASERDLDRLGSICFGLWDAARWESGASCAQVEFELLRLAARVADRPGHVLLVQSLQRAFMVGAAELLPLLGGEPLRQWVNCAKDALHDRDTRAIQHALPALMKAHDDLVLDAFAPVAQRHAVPEVDRAQQGQPVATASVVEEQVSGCLEPAAEDSVCSHDETSTTEPAGGIPLAPTAPRSDGDEPRTVAGGLSDSPSGAVLTPSSQRGRTLDRLRWWASRLWRFIASSLGARDS